ncbi:MAG: hypothetical protein H5T62_08770 [Anaerolineae bacterium]|nr:hypothetical protein [Anaerolineae bacterium]
MRQGDVVYYIHADHLGSVSVVSDGSGALLAAQRYYPYGESRTGELASLPTDFGFTGQRNEGTIGLYDYRARFYDPVLGRFVSADTVVPNPGNPQDLNRYAYVRNNPLRYTDPSGYWVETAWDILNIAWDIYEIRRDPRNLWNWGALVVDVGTALLPGVPAFAGAVSKGSKTAKVAAHADEVVDAARVLSHADEAVDALRAAEQVEDAADALRGVEHLSEAAVSLERFRSVGRENIPQVLGAFGDAGRAIEDIPEAFQGRRVTTLGRTWDIEAAKELGGFRVLDDPNWSIERNYEWLMEAIENGDVFYLASPVTEEALTGKAKWGGVSVYMRELDLLLQAGYRRVGDYLIPPR